MFMTFSDDGPWEDPGTRQYFSSLVGKQPRKVYLPFRKDVFRLGQLTVYFLVKPCPLLPYLQFSYQYTYIKNRPSAKWRRYDWKDAEVWIIRILAPESRLTPVRDGKRLLLPFHVKTRGFDGLLVTTDPISTTLGPNQRPIPNPLTSNSIGIKNDVTSDQTW